MFSGQFPTSRLYVQNLFRNGPLPSSREVAQHHQEQPPSTARLVPAHVETAQTLEDRHPLTINSNDVCHFGQTSGERILRFQSDPDEGRAKTVAPYSDVTGAGPSS